MADARPGEEMKQGKTGLPTRLRRLVSIPFAGRPKRSPADGTRSRLRMALRCGATGRFGQTFWDIHQGTVEYHIVPHQPYHSYIEGDGFRIETDSDGRPLLIELTGKANALIGEGLAIPAVDLLSADLRFLDVRIRHSGGSVSISNDRSMAYVSFFDDDPARFVSVAPGAIWALTNENHLCGLWLFDILADHNGGQRDRWRRHAWTRARRLSSARPGGTQRELSPVSVGEESSNSTICA